MLHYVNDVKLINVNDESYFEVKSTFSLLKLSFTVQLDLGFYFLSIGKTTSMKIGALSRSMRSLSHNVVLYYEKSSLRWYACLTKLQKLLSRVVGSLLLVNHNRLLSGEIRPLFFSFNDVSGCKIRLRNSRIPSRLNINFFLPNCFLPTHTLLLLK